MDTEVKDKLIKAGVLAATLLVGVALGYYALPSKVEVKTEVKVVEKEVIKTVVKVVEKKSTDYSKDIKKDKVVIIVETVLPDGTKRKETKIVDKGTVTVDLSQNSESTKNSSTETVKDKVATDKTSSVTTHEKDGLLIYAIAGANVTNWQEGPQFGAGINKRLLGPFWLGGYGTHKGNVGVTLGVSF